MPWMHVLPVALPVVAKAVNGMLTPVQADGENWSMSDVVRGAAVQV